MCLTMIGIVRAGPAGARSGYFTLCSYYLELKLTAACREYCVICIEHQTVNVKSSIRSCNNVVLCIHCDAMQMDNVMYVYRYIIIAANILYCNDELAIRYRMHR